MRRLRLVPNQQNHICSQHFFTDGWIPNIRNRFEFFTESLPSRARQLASNHLSPNLRQTIPTAEYDKPANGGNGNGNINQQDSIFSSLRLWQDTNHNGISEASELKTLVQLGLRKIDLDHHQSRQTDEFGNRFKDRAKVRDSQDAQLGRWAWNVFLVTEPLEN